MDPDSNFMILEQLAQARDQASWNALMAPALAQRNCQVIQSTSDEAPGLLAYVEHYLEAHHSPDVFHVQHALGKAVSWTCSHDTGHIWEEILPHPSESRSLILKALERQ